MEIKVIIIGGKMQIFVDGAGVSVEQAEAATKGVLASLQAAGMPVEQTSGIEQHRAGGEPHAHIVQQQQAGHSH